MNRRFPTSVSASRSSPTTGTPQQYGGNAAANTHQTPLVADRGGFRRTDVSCTVFLSEPDTYQGGALEIESTAGLITWKLSAGDAILSPSGALHRVPPVTADTRLVAVTWMQSRVADAHQRGILHDLDLACMILNQRAGSAPEARLARKTYGDLMRMLASD